MKNTVKRMCYCALGIALYACVSMVLKIPLIGHTSLDLGYIVLAVYCYLFDPFTSAAVGGIGCILVSLMTSTWISVGWIIGNCVISLMCSIAYKLEPKKFFIRDFAVTIVSVFIGIFVMKTLIECLLFSIPILVKIPKTFVAFLTDAFVMCIGVIVSYKVDSIMKK